MTTKEILKLAALADPDGVRTMCVLTKPDLIPEKASRDAVLNLIRDKRGVPKLGYHVVKNCSADDHDSTDPLATELAFFRAPPWPSVADRCGIISLGARLQELLTSISNQEFPHIKTNVERKLRQCKKQLDTMGPSRADQYSQTHCLVKLSFEFQRITQLALNGCYAADKFFQLDPNLKLATAIIKLNEVFADTFAQVGHRRRFRSSKKDDREESFGTRIYHFPSEIDSITKYVDHHPELEVVMSSAIQVFRQSCVSGENFCLRPSKESIMKLIEEVYASSRGTQLGTVRICHQHNTLLGFSNEFSVWWSHPRHGLCRTIKHMGPFGTHAHGHSDQSGARIHL